METLGADSDDSQINCQPIAGAHFADKVDVVFEIHRARLAATVIGVAEPDGWVERVARVIEDGDNVPDIYMLVAVRPFSARDRGVAGRSQLLNLL